MALTSSGEGPEEETDGRVEKLVSLAHTLVADWARLPNVRTGCKSGTEQFKQELRSRAFAEFCTDYGDKRFCGDDSLSFDFCIGSTAIEIVMHLRDANSRFEHSLLKALMAQAEGYELKELVFLAKQGARYRCETPACKALTAWIEMEHGLVVRVCEFHAGAERILD